MKTRSFGVGLFHAWLALFAAPSQAETAIWQPFATQEMEFAVAGTLDDGAQVIGALEDGYDGAWWFGNAFDGLPFTAVAQTFSVPSAITLGSVALRVAGFRPNQPSGHFEVAIHAFDADAQAPGAKLAAVQADAAGFASPLDNAPMSSFDFSAFHITLAPARTYAIAVTPLADFTGGHLTLQAATDIYPDGSVHVFSPIPEPRAGLLCMAGAIIAGVAGRRTRKACGERKATGPGETGASRAAAGACHGH